MFQQRGLLPASVLDHHGISSVGSIYPQRPSFTGNGTHNSLNCEHQSERGELEWQETATDHFPILNTSTITVSVR